MPSRSYRINTPPVALETIDEETIIVNLETGSYYDLGPVGGHVLHALDGGADRAAAIESVCARWQVDPAAVAPAIERLVEELLAEEILVAAPAGEPAGAPAIGAGPSAYPYKEPKLGKHTDMQELLLLDPVHEVDPAGWPGRA